MCRTLLLCGMVLVFSSCTASARPPVDPTRQEKNVTGGKIVITYEGDSGDLDRAAVDRWVDTAVNAVTAYFGHYPVKRLDLVVKFDDADDVHNGVTRDGRKIIVSVGRKTKAAELAKDWILTHEMFHLAFPQQDEAHRWMEEGLSVYLEPLARARIGNMPVEEYWLEIVKGMPQGLPGRGDRGLDHTREWGRTYWGGALFWMTADVRIREQTQNRKSLDDAIRAVLEAGGNGTADWPAVKVLEAGDAATATHVLRDLYAETARKPGTTDLDELWKKLGVSVRQKRVTFNENAPLAEVRRSMTVKTKTD